MQVFPSVGLCGADVRRGDGPVPDRGGRLLRRDRVPSDLTDLGAPNLVKFTTLKDFSGLPVKICRAGRVLQVPGGGANFHGGEFLDFHRLLFRPGRKKLGEGPGPKGAKV